MSDARRTHAARRLVEARVLYEREPTHQNQTRLERAEQRYVAAQSRTRPAYLKGERL